MFSLCCLVYCYITLCLDIEPANPHIYLGCSSVSECSSTCNSAVCWFVCNYIRISIYYMNESVRASMSSRACVYVYVYTRAHTHARVYICGDTIRIIPHTSTKIYLHRPRTGLCLPCHSSVNNTEIKV